MANAGEHQIVVLEVVFSRGGGTIGYNARYRHRVVDGALKGVDISDGQIGGTFGTPAAWRAMTGLQMENQVLADMIAGQAAGTVPQGAIS